MIIPPMLFAIIVQSIISSPTDSKYASAHITQVPQTSVSFAASPPTDTTQTSRVSYSIQAKSAPTPTPMPQPVANTPLSELFAKYAQTYNVDQSLLIKIAKCESGLNPNAKSRLYSGLFQFAQPTWIAYRNRLGLDPNPDLRTNAEESIRTAAYLISLGGQNSWPTCSK